MSLMDNARAAHELSGCRRCGAPVYLGNCVVCGMAEAGSQAGPGDVALLAPMPADTSPLGRAKAFVAHYDQAALIDFGACLCEGCATSRRNPSYVWP